MLKSLVVLSLLVGCSFAAVASQCLKTESKKVEQCTKLLQDEVAGIQKMLGAKFDATGRKELNDNCKKAQECFGDLKKKCPDFPKDATEILDYLCGKVAFITGPFSECMKKLESVSTTPTPGCASKIFNINFIEKPKTACAEFKQSLACKSDVGKLCDAKAEKAYADEYQKDLKAFKC
ncbi:unnamed protein product [Caenorhabditis bovis]|uniref:T20D4.11-like domain-containing protein n=1 Tax=Caenorhabditis bovis TaxID=2654633 RepID=A0A8S1ECF8_9PELO|nr:unnamed protein product [Caenorhabditis bovis]